jgi:large subunit ribosomal protein L19
MNKVYSKSAFNLSLLTKKITEKYLAIDRPIPRVGDFVRIGFEISEGQKTRVQIYQGLVLAIQGDGITKSILVRRAFKSFCSERLVLINSPQVKELTILNHTNVRRSKLYYVRKLQGKQARILTGRVGN